MSQNKAFLLEGLFNVGISYSDGKLTNRAGSDLSVRSVSISICSLTAWSCLPSACSPNQKLRKDIPWNKKPEQNPRSLLVSRTHNRHQPGPGILQSPCEGTGQVIMGSISVALLAIKWGKSHPPSKNTQCSNK